MGQGGTVGGPRGLGAMSGTRNQGLGNNRELLLE